MLSLIRSGPLRLYLPTHLPSERLMLSAPLAAPSPQRYYAGSDSCRASYTTRQASPVHPLAFWTCHPQPRRAPGTSRALPPRASGRLVAEPGFAETLGSSPLHAAESGSYSYSLPIRLQLLPTPSRSDATTLPLERRSCFQLYVRQLHTVRTHTVLTNELTDALGAGFKPAPTALAWNQPSRLPIGRLKPPIRLHIAEFAQHLRELL